MSAAVRNQVEKLIDTLKIVVFSKSYCPYCIKAKDILASLKADFYAMELDKESNGSEIQAYLLQKTGQRTVPNIFIAKQHIGGCSDLTELYESGELQRRLEQLK